MYLLDKSALARIRTSDVVAKALHPLFAARVIATCTIIDLEVCYSARAVQKELVERSPHRGVCPNDLLIAACAEVHGATVLHYDRDFDVIAEVTGQPSLWVAPPGSVS